MARDTSYVHVPEDGDICTRMVGENRYEVEKWVGDLRDGGWQAQKTMTLSELHKYLGSRKFLGEHKAWEYYRLL